MLLTYLFAGAAGALLGFAELISRYRDAPRKLWRINAFYLYLGLNALLALASLAVIQTIGSDLLPTAGEIAASLAEKAGAQNPTAEMTARGALYLSVYQVLAAGFGGAAFFRSSLLKTKVGGTEIGLGPSFVIDIMLVVTDRSIDRARARERAEEVPAQMREVPSGFAATQLSDYCIGLMQNLSAAEREDLKLNIAALMKDAEQESPMKSIQIGLLLVNYLGFRTLQSAVISLAPEIEAERTRLNSISREALMAVIGADG